MHYGCSFCGATEPGPSIYTGATSMGFWQTVQFGRKAYRLKRGASAPPQRIQRRARRRLERLVAHARAHSPFWREKLAGIPDDSFSIYDLPTCNKTELMANFDR